jgi:glycosyltransferase involved in cell wall biosynthesis
MLDECTPQKKLYSSQRHQEPVVALLPWGHAWEDFHDSIGVSFEAFCNEMTGGWQFGYIDALRSAGVRTVVIYPSTRFTEPARFTHGPTDSTVCMLPVPQSYRSIRQQMIKPYPSFGGNWQELFGEAQGISRFRLKVFKELAPYLSTPLGLVARELRSQGCSAILCQEYEYFRFDVCVLLGQLLRLPVFGTFQGTTGRYDGVRIGNALRKLTMRASSGLIIGPQTEIQRVQGLYNLPSEKIAQIFNPLDLRMWEIIDHNEARAKFNIPSNAQVVVWHGRVEIEIKGLDILLNAWEQICQQRPERELRLLLMGTGKDAEKLRQRIAALPNQNVIWVDKYINDRTFIQSFLSTGDVYAFPSRVEGFPVAPIEAMACGLPVVAAAAPGIPDILEGGELSGGIVVPRNDAKAFTEALSRVLDDERLRQELGKRARSRVEENFSLETVGKQLRDFLLKSTTFGSGNLV